MKKPILIIGCHKVGKTAMLKLLAEKNLNKEDVIIITPDEAEKRGLKISEPTDLNVEMDDLVLKITESKHEKIFKPKKIHPKHQRKNKYRHK